MPPQMDDSRAGARDKDAASLLLPVVYDDDASSIHSRSEQESDSDDDQLQQRARNSRELAAHDRIVLMQEEETDELVTRSLRQREMDSMGPLGKAATLFARRPSQTRLPSPSNASSKSLSREERRNARRARRKERNDRLVADAATGEDRALMFEMESGGMREGSDTGESSEREDSDEMDRLRLKEAGDTRGSKGRRLRRWLLLHSLIVVVFGLLLFGAWKLSTEEKNAKTFVKSGRLVSNGTATFAPTTILISLDGFRADFLQRGLTPRLNAFVKEGVSPKYMLPSFPSVTFPVGQGSCFTRSRG